MGPRKRYVSFTVRTIHNLARDIICKTAHPSEHAPKTQLQGGILGYLYHHQETPVYQKDIEREFKISRATVTNTLQVMEKNGLIIRKSETKDARLKRIIMTEESKADHARFEEHVEMMNERMLRGLKEEEAERLKDYLDVVMRNLEEWKAEFSDTADNNENDENA